MRRLVALVLGLAVAAALALAANGGAQNSAVDGPAAGDLRVDAIFDTAKGIVPGQLVKIAGARVGEVKDVVLTERNEARIQLSVDSRFAPFRQDARCEIQPEGLISENFVQCDPGTPASPALEARGDEVPTVPIERTSVPINLTDLFEVWEVPVRDRLRIILTSLGAGVAARGEDLNAVLRRANPTLGLVRQAVETVNAQRDDLLATVDQAHDVMKELAREPRDLQAFVSESAETASTTARRKAELRDGLRRLPGLLAAARPALRNLDRFAEQGTPVARQLRGAAGDLDALVAEIPDAARPALPAFKALGRTSVTGRKAIKSATPVVKLLRTFARSAVPAGDELEKTLVSLRDRGFVEGLQSFVYFATAATARYDAVGHMLPAHLQLSLCGLYAEEPQEGCSAKYNETHAARKRAVPKRKAGRKEQSEREAPAPERPKLLQPRPGTEAPKVPALPLPQVTKPLTDAVQGVLDALGGGGKGSDKGGGLGTERLLELLLGPS